MTTLKLIDCTRLPHKKSAHPQRRPRQPREIAAMQAMLRRCHDDLLFRSRFVSLCQASDKVA